MRPRPGAARMYPETDIPPVQVTKDHIKKIRLPELPEQKLKRLMENYKLNQKLAKQVIDSEYNELFEIIVKESTVSPTIVAAFLTETLKALKREGIQIEKVSENQIREIFRSIASGELTKEAIPHIFSWLSTHEGKNVQEAMSNLNLKILSVEELEKIIMETIEDNKKFVKEQGANAFGLLMGIVMKKVRGKANSDMVSKLLMKKLKQT
ncbi:MAG: Glu-tRNA(Gln) amidotransferase subunit GatE, partial [Candidatus Bathycorpusculaceae bacterium]